MAAMVPKGLMTDIRSGEAFEYGGYPAQLHDCEICHGVFSNIEQHAGTTFHKRFLL